MLDTRDRVSNLTAMFYVGYVVNNAGQCGKKPFVGFTT